MNPNNLYIALGSNDGNKLQNLQKAWNVLNAVFSVVTTSKVYESKPILYLPQQNFLNMAILCHSYSSHPFTDFMLIKKIERLFSPTKSIAKGPRKLDLDLIFWNNLVYTNQELTVPHNAFAHRDFVLNPIRDIMTNDILKNFHLQEPLDVNIISSFNFSL
jgi:2-amino-4-hydroxy-6-hydroxymethyldihydropteridine diphosphokinase